MASFLSLLIYTDVIDVIILRESAPRRIASVRAADRKVQEQVYLLLEGIIVA